jgi:hypothetical protein
MSKFNWAPLVFIQSVLLVLAGLDLVFKNDVASAVLFIVICVVTIILSIGVLAIGALSKQAGKLEGSGQKEDAEALAILGTYILGEEGDVPTIITYEREAIQWAYNRMQYRHAQLDTDLLALERLMKSKE